MADPSITQSEIDNIEKEVNAKLANEAKKTNEDFAKKVREEVEKEFKQKQELDELRMMQKKMAEEVEAAKLEAKKAKEEAEKGALELKESVKKQMEEMMAQRRGITMGNQSPFQTSTPVGPDVRTLPNGKTIAISQLSPQEMDAIEEESRQKFMDYLGIQNQDARREWGVPPKKQY